MFAVEEQPEMRMNTRRRESIRVLLADQHALFREAVRDAFATESNFDVDAEASNGAEALQRAERKQPHVAVLDIDLPGGDGVRITSRIRERVPTCRVLILSPREDYRILVEALDAGASGYLTKEALLSDLIHATRAIHRGETLVPPRMLGPLLTSLLRWKDDLDRRYERISRLTPREREVLALLAEGADNEEISEMLAISRQTARTHIQNILEKLQTHSRLEAVAYVRGGTLDTLGDAPVSGAGELTYLST
jgi:DNA-binding NarL/FixJ family response regulator